MKLKRLRQCEKCPWKKNTNPEDIPNGYSIEKHRALKNTIADPDEPLSTLGGNELRIMACHETHSAHCVGWLHNQLGVGNNILLRISMLSCDNIDKIKVIGPQHENFNDTLPGGGSCDAGN